MEKLSIYPRPIVKQCKAWGCNNQVVTNRRRGNNSGSSQYCSILCYSKCTPAKIKVSKELGIVVCNDEDPYEEFFYRLGLYILKYGWKGSSKRLGVSTDTLRRWMFEGQ